MSDRAGRGLQVARDDAKLGPWANRRHSRAYVEDFRGRPARPAGREQARRRQIRSVRALVRWAGGGCFEGVRARFDCGELFGVLRWQL
jgi:hypothetical protein